MLEKPQKDIILGAPVLSNAGMFVEIFWEMSEQVQNVTFQIEFQASDFTWHEDLTGCDGSDSQIQEAKFCQVSIATLMSRPFFLEVESQVFARLSI